MSLLFTGTAGCEEEPPQTKFSASEYELIMQAGSKNFTAVFADNKTSLNFIQKLPMDVPMEELNGNEKYIFLPFTLPVEHRAIGEIKAGDIMLYGDNCLVLFYKTCKTSYRYTPIARITDTRNLEEVLGKGNVHIRFEVNKK